MSNIMDYLLVGKDQQQTNQPNDQAGGCLYKTSHMQPHSSAFSTNGLFINHVQKP